MSWWYTGAPAFGHAVALLRPFSACLCLIRWDPGRCPGLNYLAPSALNEPLRIRVDVHKRVSLRRPPSMAPVPRRLYHLLENP